MSAVGLMIHRCAIHRATSSVTSSGSPTESYAAVATGVRCRFSFVRGDEAAGSKGDQGIVRGMKVFMPFGTDVRERDMLVNVVDRYGTVLLASGDVETVSANPGGVGSHVEVWVKEVRGS